MSKAPSNSISLWTARHALFVWLGILLNLLFILPLLFDPVWLLGFFHLTDQPDLSGRASPGFCC